MSAPKTAPMDSGASAAPAVTPASRSSGGTRASPSRCTKRSTKPRSESATAAWSIACTTFGSFAVGSRRSSAAIASATRSEEHTSELQSQSNLVCRLLLEKKNSIGLALLLTKPPLAVVPLVLTLVPGRRYLLLAFLPAAPAIAIVSLYLYRPALVVCSPAT